MDLPPNESINAKSMKRCIECGRPYRGGLNGPALLELALGELGENGLEADHPTDLIRLRRLADQVLSKIEAALETKAAAMIDPSRRLTYKG
jgi:hypothetical protein